MTFGMRYDRVNQMGGRMVRQDRDKLKKSGVNKDIGAIFMPGQVILPPKTISVLLVGLFI